MDLVGIRKFTGMVLGIVALVGLAALDAIYGVPGVETIAICIASVATGHQLAQGFVDREKEKNGRGEGTSGTRTTIRQRHHREVGCAEDRQNEQSRAASDGQAGPSGGTPYPSPHGTSPPS